MFQRVIFVTRNVFAFSSSSILILLYVMHDYCSGLNVSPQNSSVETLIPRDDIRKWGLLGGN